METCTAPANAKTHPKDWMIGMILLRHTVYSFMALVITHVIFLIPLVSEAFLGYTIGLGIADQLGQLNLAGSRRETTPSHQDVPWPPNKHSHFSSPCLAKNLAAGTF